MLKSASSVRTAVTIFKRFASNATELGPNVPVSKFGHGSAKFYAMYPVEQTVINEIPEGLLAVLPDTHLSSFEKCNITI
jgi:hypothetical protein